MLVTPRGCGVWEQWGGKAAILPTKSHPGVKQSGLHPIRKALPLFILPYLMAFQQSRWTQGFSPICTPPSKTQPSPASPSNVNRYPDDSPIILMYESAEGEPTVGNICVHLVTCTAHVHSKSWRRSRAGDREGGEDTLPAKDLLHSKTPKTEFKN